MTSSMYQPSSEELVSSKKLQHGSRMNSAPCSSFRDLGVWRTIMFKLTASTHEMDRRPLYNTPQSAPSMGLLNSGLLSTLQSTARATKIQAPRKDSHPRRFRHVLGTCSGSERPRPKMHGLSECLCKKAWAPHRESKHQEFRYRSCFRGTPNIQEVIQK